MHQRAAIQQPKEETLFKIAFFFFLPFKNPSTVNNVRNQFYKFTIRIAGDVTIEKCSIFVDFNYHIIHLLNNTYY